MASVRLSIFQTGVISNRNIVIGRDVIVKAASELFVMKSVTAGPGSIVVLCFVVAPTGSLL
jgi:hypothetical protein